MKRLLQISFLSVLLMLALCPAIVAAGPLVVVDGGGDVIGGVLRLGSGPVCCEEGGCRGVFQLDNDSLETLRDVTFTASDLTSGGQSIPAASVRFTPSLLPKLGPAGIESVEVTIDLPASVFGGSYAGTIAIRADTGVEVILDVELAVCGDPAVPGLQFVGGQGDLSGEVLSLVAGDDGCSGALFRGQFFVQASGNVELSAVRPRLVGLPPGSSATFEPEELPLAPGAKAEFEVTVRTVAGLAPGTYSSVLTVGDAGSGATDTAAAVLRRCPVPVPGLRIVLGRPPTLEFQPASTRGGGDCLGERFELFVTVENTGEVDLTEVALSLDGMPPELALSVEPESLALAVGARARFEVVASGAPLPTLYRSTLTVQDQVTGALDAMEATLERCGVDEPVDTDDPPKDPEPLVLTLAHRASRSAARVGDVLTLTCEIENLSGGTARDVEVESVLPPGVRYVDGRSALDGAAFDEPRGGGYGRCRWTIPEIAPYSSASLRFQVVVTSAAPLGPAIASAYARTDVVDVGPVDATVELTRSSLRLFGAVRGKVRFSDGGAVDGVRLLLDSDRLVETDEEGRFEFPGVLGGEHLVSLDGRTLGRGERLIGADSRLFRLFEGASEELEFVVRGRPTLNLSVVRVDLNPDGKNEQ